MVQKKFMGSVRNNFSFRKLLGFSAIIGAGVFLIWSYRKRFLNDYWYLMRERKDDDQTQKNKIHQNSFAEDNFTVCTNRHDLSGKSKDPEVDSGSEEPTTLLQNSLVTEICVHNEENQIDNKENDKEAKNLSYSSSFSILVIL